MSATTLVSKRSAHHENDRRRPLLNRQNKYFSPDYYIPKSDTYSLSLDNSSSTHHTFLAIHHSVSLFKIWLQPSTALAPTNPALEHKIIFNEFLKSGCKKAFCFAGFQEILIFATRPRFDLVYRRSIVLSVPGCLPLSQKIFH